MRIGISYVEARIKTVRLFAEDDETMNLKATSCKSRPIEIRTSQYVVNVDVDFHIVAGQTRQCVFAFKKQLWQLGQAFNEPEIFHQKYS